MEILDVYVDGSFKNGKTKWAFIVIDNNEIIHQDTGIIVDPVIKEGRQVGGECQAVIESLKWAAANNKRIRIFYDFVGLRAWISDLFGEKPWKRNKSYTISYRESVFKYRDYLKDMIKVKAHSGNKWNEKVDGLM